MAVISKIVFDLKPVKDENIFDVEKDCASHLGKLLSKALKENTEKNKERPIKLPLYMEVESYGKLINFNTNSIVYESYMYLADPQDSLTQQLVFTFTFEEGLDLNKDSNNSYNKLCELLGEDTEVSIKVLKIGNTDYSCYTINCGK